MNALTPAELEHLSNVLAERKRALLEEIQDVLKRVGEERFVDLGGLGDAADESVANLLGEIGHAEVRRDVSEVRDITAAEGRMAHGRYGVCIDCGTDVPYERLAAYPTAKRCLECQRQHENTHTSAPSRRL